MAGPSVLAQLKFEKADFYVSNNTAFNSSLNMAQRVALYAFRQQAIVVRRRRNRSLRLTCAPLMQGKCNTPKPGFFELVEEVKKRWCVLASSPLVCCLSACPAQARMEQPRQHVA